MIEISKDKYGATSTLLDYASGDKTFAYSIIENRQSGKIYVDNEIDIKSVLFWHDCGFGLLAQKTLCNDSVAAVIDLINERHPSSKKSLILQVLDGDLNNKIELAMNQDKSVRTGQRLVFRFNRSRFKEELFPVPLGCRIVSIDSHLFEKLKGNIVPTFSWRSPEEFADNGIGFCLLKEDEILSASFSCFVGNGQIDIGIETPPKYRKHGFAKIIASKLITFCLDNSYQPIWGCVKNNIGSQKIAISLGFELVGENPYYYKLQRT